MTPDNSPFNLPPPRYTEFDENLPYLPTHIPQQQISQQDQEAINQALREETNRLLTYTQQQDRHLAEIQRLSQEEVQSAVDRAHRQAVRLASEEETHRLLAATQRPSSQSSFIRTSPQEHPSHHLEPTHRNSNQYYYVRRAPPGSLHTLEHVRERDRPKSRFKVLIEATKNQIIDTCEELAERADALEERREAERQEAERREAYQERHNITYSSRREIIYTHEHSTSRHHRHHDVCNDPDHDCAHRRRRPDMAHDEEVLRRLHERQRPVQECRLRAAEPGMVGESEGENESRPKHKKSKRCKKKEKKSIARALCRWFTT